MFGLGCLAFLLDPSWIFGLACMLAPPLVSCTPLVSLSKLAPRECAISRHFVHPIPIAGLLLCLTWSLYCQQGSVTLSSRDKRVANWYLVNGFVFKSMMDTFSGSLQAWPTMTAQYNLLEPRYQKPLSDFDSIPVHLSSLLEIAFQVPLCLLVYRAYHQGSKHRYVLEIVLATLQAAGTFYFYLAGLITEPEKLGMFMNASMFDFVFYCCFGSIFCPLLWIVLPVLCIRSAAGDIARLCESKEKGS